MLKRRIREITGSPVAKVDRDSGIIRDVRILGPKSKNNRRYTESCIRRAIQLYEGVGVNIDHIGGDETRSYRDRVGCLKNVRMIDGGLNGDLHANPKHPLAEQLFWDAEHSPANLGLSHHADANTRMEDGTVVVEEILQVFGVDLVADPATTNSLFESKGADSERNVPPKDSEERAAIIGRIRSAMMDVLSSEKLTHADKLAKMRELLKSEEKISKLLADQDAILDNIKSSRENAVESFVRQVMGIPVEKGTARFVEAITGKESGGVVTSRNIKHESPKDGKSFATAITE